MPFLRIGQTKCTFQYKLHIKQVQQLRSEAEFKEVPKLFLKCKRNKKMYQTDLKPIAGGAVHWDSDVSFVAHLFWNKKAGFEKKFFVLSVQTPDKTLDYSTGVDLAKFARKGESYSEELELNLFPSGKLSLVVSSEDIESNKNSLATEDPVASVDGAPTDFFFHRNVSIRDGNSISSQKRGRHSRHHSHSQSNNHHHHHNNSSNNSISNNNNNNRHHSHSDNHTDSQGHSRESSRGSNPRSTLHSQLSQDSLLATKEYYASGVNLHDIAGDEEEEFDDGLGFAFHKQASRSLLERGDEKHMDADLQQEEEEEEEVPSPPPSMEPTVDLNPSPPLSSISSSPPAPPSPSPSDYSQQRRAAAHSAAATKIDVVSPTMRRREHEVSAGRSRTRDSSDSKEEPYTQSAQDIAGYDHAVGRRPTQCVMCNKFFKTTKDLVAHVEKHTQDSITNHRRIMAEQREKLERIRNRSSGSKRDSMDMSSKDGLVYVEHKAPIMDKAPASQSQSVDGDEDQELVSTRLLDVEALKSAIEIEREASASRSPAAQPSRRHKASASVDQGSKEDKVDLCPFEVHIMWEGLSKDVPLGVIDLAPTFTLLQARYALREDLQHAPQEFGFLNPFSNRLEIVKSGLEHIIRVSDINVKDVIKIVDRTPISKPEQPGLPENEHDDSSEHNEHDEEEEPGLAA